ncbi:hypothetical protein OSB04_001217 [Centaurea solstitialis]|uniref:Uncharacterized protein n=1 Tax=Centaurea solstitialis TaxID=347529 RepID=A0AA38WUU9_9ASTR|nr:hypothetical protein OSB04_001217 [Centaurea solstitialis]
MTRKDILGFTLILEISLKFFCLRLAYSRKKLEEVLPERLPIGMVKEFDESMREALLVRHNFLDLRDISGVAKPSPSLLSR